MKYARALLLIFSCIAATNFLGSLEIQRVVVLVAALLPVLHFQHNRTGQVAYSRTFYVLMALLLLMLTRYELTKPSDSSGIVFNAETLNTEISSRLVDQARAEQQALRDSDPEKWRQEMRSRLAEMRR